MKAERTTAVENLIVVIEDGCFVLGSELVIWKLCCEELR